MANGPLHGVRVLEFSQIVAVPFLGTILSDMGAEVVKVEPPGGDQHRSWGAIVPNEGKRFHSLNRGKRDLAINLQDPRGREVIHRLVPRFDIVAHNYRWGVADRLGVGYDTLRAINPRLIFLEVTGWGTTGPMRDLAGADPVVTAYSGVMAGDGKVGEDGQPLMVSCAPISDVSAGFSAAAGVLAALYHRERTGEGQRVETSLLRSALAIQPTVVMREPVSDAMVRDPMLDRVREVRARGGSFLEVLEARQLQRFDSAALAGFIQSYQTSDGVLMLGAVTPKLREVVREVLGIADDPADQPGFDAADPASHVYGRERKAYIANVMRVRTTAEWMELLSAAGVPAAPAALPEEMVDDPQVQADGIMVELEHPLTGPQQVVGPIVNMSATPTSVSGPSPTLGADNDALLEEAGYSSDEVSDLRSAGVVL